MTTARRTYSPTPARPDQQPDLDALAARNLDAPDLDALAAHQ